MARKLTRLQTTAVKLLPHGRVVRATRWAMPGWDGVSRSAYGGPTEKCAAVRRAPTLGTRRKPRIAAASFPH